MFLDPKTCGHCLWTKIKNSTPYQPQGEPKHPRPLKTKKNNNTEELLGSITERIDRSIRKRR